MSGTDAGDGSPTLSEHMLLLREWEREPWVMVIAIGLDIAKSIFQVHGVDAAGEVVSRVSSFFSTLRTAALVACLSVGVGGALRSSADPSDFDDRRPKTFDARSLADVPALRRDNSRRPNEFINVEMRMAEHPERGTPSLDFGA